MSALRKFFTDEITPNFSSISPRCAHLIPPGFRENSLAHNAIERINSDVDTRFAERQEWKSRILRKLLPGSQRACVLTFVATALGSGVLALPFAFAKVGLVLGALMLTVACLLGAISLTILMMAARYTEAPTFAALLASATGSAKAGLLMDAIVLIYGTASLVALFIFEGDFLPAILQSFTGGEGQWPTPSRERCIIATALLAWPLVLPSEVSALRYVAAFSPFAILLMGFTVLAEVPRQLAIDVIVNRNAVDHSHLKFWDATPVEFLQAMSIFFFSVMCHTNAVPVAQMLERPSVYRIVKVACFTNLLCWVLYMLIGIGGYLSFRGAVQGDFLLNYPTTSMPIQFCRALLAVVCFVGLTLNMTPCVQAARNLSTAAASFGHDLEAKESKGMHALLATVVLATATVGGIHLLNAATVIGLLGGSLTTLQMFWMPAIVYRQLVWQTQPKTFRVLALTILLTAGVVGFASLAANL